MARLRQIPPTASYPIALRDIFRLGQAGSLAQDFREFLGVEYARVTCSGTVALYLTLEAIKQLTPKRTMIMPSFICPLVGLAGVRAGYTLAVCDMQQNGQLDYDYAKLEALCAATPDAGVILIAHLGGMASDIVRLQALAERYGLLIIEDCAQGFGAEVDGKKVGTFGDFAFYSFARGKGLTLYEGGVLVTRHAKYAALLEDAYQRLVPSKPLTETMTLLGLLAYGVFYRPWLFWFIFDITYLLWNRLGDEVRAASELNNIDFPIYRMSGLRQRLGHAFFHQVKPQMERQRASAAAYIAALKGCSNFRVMDVLPNSRGTYPYVTLVLPDRAKRDAMLHRLRAEGLGAFIIYIRALNRYDYMKPYMTAEELPGAQHLADCTLTLSTNLYLTEQDRARIVQILREDAHA